MRGDSLFPQFQQSALLRRNVVQNRMQDFRPGSDFHGAPSPEFNWYFLYAIHLPVYFNNVVIYLGVFGGLWRLAVRTLLVVIESLGSVMFLLFF